MKKKLLALLLACAMVFSLVACGNQNNQPNNNQQNNNNQQQDNQQNNNNNNQQDNNQQPEADPLADLIKAAQAEGELVVYGSCEDPYIAAACAGFQEKYGITTTWQRLTGGEVQAKIEEENGNPSADVWFGGTKVGGQRS